MQIPSQGDPPSSMDMNAFPMLPSRNSHKDKTTYSAAATRVQSAHQGTPTTHQHQGNGRRSAGTTSDSSNVVPPGPPESDNAGPGGESPSSLTAASNSRSLAHSPQLPPSPRRQLKKVVDRGGIRSVFNQEVTAGNDSSVLNCPDGHDHQTFTLPSSGDISSKGTNHGVSRHTSHGRNAAAYNFRHCRPHPAMQHGDN